MLNVDYKILSKALALRLEPVLNYIIDEDQTGFMQNRSISTNIRKTFEIVQYTEQKNIPAIIMAIGFEKCFDRIEHTTIIGALEYFGFGPNYIQWIKTIPSDFEVCTQNSGYISDWFFATRRCHQGCCIAPLIFLLCGQILSHKIKGNLIIKTVEVYEVLAFISQFAHETNLYLSFDKITEKLLTPWTFWKLT